MKPVLVVGAGFSGLTLAYHLHRLGVPVEIVEKETVPGGMIQTRASQFGLVESAANAVLANAEIEALFAELQLDFAPAKKERKNRYIFWRKPRRWPLSWVTTFRLTWALIKIKLRMKDMLPCPAESVGDWAERTVDRQLEERLLSPALQGIYASEGQDLSANLVLKPWLIGARPRRGKHRGSVAPAKGMGDLVSALTRYLQNHGVQIHFGRSFTMPAAPAQPTVICTSAWVAAQMVRPWNAALADQLGKCLSLPLLSATAFFATSAKDLKGFGCLFPRRSGFRALGVLFNASIFAGRSAQRSETWIFGGASDPECVRLSDEEIKQLIVQDRECMGQDSAAPLDIQIARWPRAIPHYTVEWEKTLAALNVKSPLFLHGNYLGGLGLAQIHQRSKMLAQQIRDLYVR